jgi:hypothetical protein
VGDPLTRLGRTTCKLRPTPFSETYGSLVSLDVGRDLHLPVKLGEVTPSSWSSLVVLELGDCEAGEPHVGG